MTKTSKEELAEIALSLFAAKGFTETSIGDIEKAAGLTPRAGGFYRHFASKEAVLIESVRAMASELIAEIRLGDVLAQKSVKAELLIIAQSLLDHAEDYRTLRLLLQREAHKLPALREVMREANLTLARQDIVPWTEHALKRIGRNDDPTTFAFIVFGPVLLYLISEDRGQPAFGLRRRTALDAWAGYWAAELKPKRRTRRNPNAG